MPGMTLAAARQAGTAQVVNADLPTNAFKRATVMVTSKAPTCRLGETVVIDVAIRNDGAVPMFLYGEVAWGHGGGFILHLRDQNGNEIAPRLRDDTMLSPPRSNSDPSLFVRLNSGNFFGTTRSILASNLVAVPGEYSLQVEYRSAAPRKYFAPDLQRLHAIWHEDPSIYSNQVSLSVKP